MDTLPEIEEKLATLLEQFKQVEAALAIEPENEELLNAKKELSEVITMTEDLYNLKRNEEEKAHNSTPTEHNLQFGIGAKVEAIYSADGRWYPAVVVGSTDAGNYKVRFLGYNNEEEVKPENTREKERKKKEDPTSKKRVRGTFSAKFSSKVTRYFTIFLKKKKY